MISNKTGHSYSILYKRFKCHMTNTDDAFIFIDLNFLSHIFFGFHQIFPRRMKSVKNPKLWNYILQSTYILSEEKIFVLRLLR